MTKTLSLEEELAKQEEVFNLADAWIERTGGVVVPGVVLDRNEWIKRVQAMPLWDRIKDDAITYVPLMQRKQIQVIDETTKTAYLLDNSLSIHQVITTFLADPDYNYGKMGTSCCSPKSFLSIVRDFSIGANGEGTFKTNKGDCGKLYQEITRGKKISEQEILEGVGLSNAWKTYQESRGIPRSYRRLARQTLDHFLKDPDYFVGKGGKFGKPRSLLSVLSLYVASANEGNGGYVINKGDSFNVYRQIIEGKFTEQELLVSIGMEEAWAAYQKTTGISREYRGLAKKTLEHFLADPDYYGGKNGADGVASFGSPRPLLSVLQRYSTSANDGKGKILNNKGDCGKIFTAIRMGYLSEEQLLESIGMKEVWKQYQETTGIPREFKDIFKKTLMKFLENPSYYNGVGGTPKDSPRTLGNILCYFSSSANNGKGGFIRKHADCSKIYQAMTKGYLAEEQLLEAVGLKQSWEDYRKSSAQNLYVFKR